MEKHSDSSLTPMQGTASLLYTEVDADTSRSIRNVISESTKPLSLAVSPVNDTLKTMTTCTICFDDIPRKRSVTLGPCTHRFCESCVYDMVTFVVYERREIPVPCPDCKVLLDNTKLLKTVEHSSIYKRFKERVEEPIYKNKRYCSNERCGVPFEWVKHPDAHDACILCPLCNHLTCAECRAPWHEEWTCEENRRIREVTSAVGELAQKNQWVPCPSCHALVERTDGCNHMHCICGQDFCYDCGAPFNIHDYEAPCDCDYDSFDRQRTGHLVDRVIVSSVLSRAANKKPLNRIEAAAGDIHGAVNMSPKVLKDMHPRIQSALLRNKCPYPECSKSFRNHRELMQHLNTVRSHPVWICCGRVFNCLSDYCRHHRRVLNHREYDPPHLRKTNVSRPGRRTIRKLGTVEFDLQMEEDYSLVTSENCDTT